MRPRVNVEALAALSPAEREVVRDQLVVVEAEFRRNPLLGYLPHARQLVFHAAPHPPLRAFFGGNRSGKTTATLLDTIVQAVDREWVPEHLQSVKRWEPPFYCRVVTPDLTNTLEGVVLQKFREWCPREQLKGGSFDRAWDKQLRILRYRNGSWIQFLSNDQDLDKFGGAALHRIVYDEEPRQDIRQECLMRTIDFGGEELFGMTPLHGMSWVFNEIYRPWTEGQLSEQDGRVVVVDMDDNPHLDKETMRRVLAGLSTEEREARKSGRFVAFAGLIYPQFTRESVLPQLEAWHDEKGREWYVPPGAEVFCGIDPGYRHMCGVVFCYLDESDELVVFDEIAMQAATVAQVCKEIKLRCERWKVRPNWHVIDPASRNKSGQTGRNDQQEFHDNGIVTIPGQNAVTAGINRVKERLEARKLFITANCRELKREFETYRWVKDQSRTEDEARERPVKKDDHLLDALRYVAMQRPLTPESERSLPTMTYKDRLLRHSLRRLAARGGKTHDSGFGPGIFT